MKANFLSAISPSRLLSPKRLSRNVDDYVKSSRVVEIIGSLFVVFYTNIIFIHSTSRARVINWSICVRFCCCYERWLSGFRLLNEFRRTVHARVLTATGIHMKSLTHNMTTKAFENSENRDNQCDDSKLFEMKFVRILGLAGRLFQLFCTNVHASGDIFSIHVLLFNVNNTHLVSSRTDDHSSLNPYKTATVILYTSVKRKPKIQF